MTEVLFYHLQNMTVENVLPPLLEKSLERGWRVVVQSSSPERADALDAHLWTYRDDSFLPHATWRVTDVAEQPIVLAIEADNPNGANAGLNGVAIIPDTAAAIAKAITAAYLSSGGNAFSTRTVKACKYPRSVMASTARRVASSGEPNCAVPRASTVSCKARVFPSSMIAW